MTTQDNEAPAIRDYEAEVAAQEKLQRTDPVAAHGQQPRIKRLARELKALSDRAQDLVRA